MPMLRWIGVVAKEFAICGKAVVMTVLSRFCMKRAAATMPRRMLWRLRVKGMGLAGRRRHSMALPRVYNRARSKAAPAERVSRFTFRGKAAKIETKYLHKN